MTNALQLYSVTPTNQLSKELQDKWIELYCRGASAAEAALFITTCMETGLSPAKRQIYLVPRQVKNPNGSYTTQYTPQTSVDGLRAIAERSGEYAGQAPAQWCGSDGIWKEVWLSADYPAAARVGVFRRGWVAPLYAIAKWDSFCPKGKFGPGKMWQNMPDIMLAKCAESQALRKAFPNEMRGLYSQEEMEQAGYNPPPSEGPALEGDTLEAEHVAPLPEIETTVDGVEIFNIKHPAHLARFDKFIEIYCKQKAPLDPQIIPAIRQEMHGRRVAAQSFYDALEKVKAHTDEHKDSL